MAQKLHFLKTIRMKLLIPILCAIIAGALIMGIFSYRKAANVIIDAATGDGLRAAQSLRRYLDLVISTVNLDLSAIVMQPSIWPVLLEGGNADELNQFLLALLDRYYIYDSIIVLDTNGLIVASTGSTLGNDRSDREYFQQSMKGKTYISGVETSRSTGNLVTFISIPVFYERSNTIIGVVLASLGIDEVNNRYVAPVALLGDYGYAMIVNREGMIIGHKDKERRGEKLPDSLLERIFSKEGQAAFEAVVDDEPSMLFIEFSYNIDWFPIVVCPVNVFYITANNLAKIIASLTIFVILLLSFVVIFMIHGIIKALSGTISYANKVSQGNLDIQLSVRRNDEVGVLAQSLRDMVGSLKHMINIAEQKTREAEDSAKTIFESITYASKIQKNLLPRDGVFESAFSDYSVIWKPRDIVGGDLYWAKNFEDGTVLCVCDCTGHGTPGALLTMLVVSALETSVTEENHKDTAQILFMIDQKLASVLNVNTNVQRSITNINDGCDLAVLFVAKDGNVTISAGNTNVFICDGNEVLRYKGQSISVGEGRLKDKEEVIVQKVTANPGNKFYIASDGLFDQIGGKNSKSFGYNTFKKIILENHHQEQAVISGKVWDAFEEYRGEQPRRDDLELITFKPL